MEVLGWIAQHWLDLLQSVGIVAGLLFTAATLRTDHRSRRVANLLTVTAHHREIWTRLIDRPALARILAPDPDLEAQPITDEEELLVLLLILHLRSAYEAMTAGMFPMLEGLRQDIRVFFSLPIPRAVWESVKRYQDEAFVVFIEACTGKRA